MQKERAKRNSIVTGGTSGIGRAITKCFLLSGINVAVIGRNIKTKRGMNYKIKPYPNNILSLHKADVRNRGEVNLAIKDIIAIHDSIDIIVVNAGVLYKADIEKLTLEQFDEMIDVNIKGAFNTVQEVLPIIKESSGHLVFICSANSIEPSPGLSVYAGTKSWLRNFGLSLQGEVAKHGILVTIINPSLTNTPMGRYNIGDRSKKNMINPNNIAEAVLFTINNSGNSVIQEINIFRKDKWSI